MIRKLEGYEQIGLIGYPGDGEYIAVLGDRERQNWLLGGEFCGLNGLSWPIGRQLCLDIIRREPALSW